MSEGELEMIRRISPVAVCCSRASVRERCTSAYDGAGWAPPWGRWRGVPHSPQNFIVGRFLCWHPGHVMPEPPSRQGRGKIGTVGRDYPPETRMVKNTVTGSRLGTGISCHHSSVACALTPSPRQGLGFGFWG